MDKTPARRVYGRAAKPKGCVMSMATCVDLPQREYCLFLGLDLRWWRLAWRTIPVPMTSERYHRAARVQRRLKRVDLRRTRWN